MEASPHDGHDTANSIEFETPMAFLMWAARTYLWHAGHGCGVPDALGKTFASVELTEEYASLCRVLDRLRESAPSGLVLHAPGCSAQSELEQSFAFAVRCLQRGNAFGYVAALSAVAPAALVRLLRADMQVVAGMLSEIERDWPEAVDDRHPGGSVVHREAPRFQH